MTYNPRDYGADCDNCPLNGRPGPTPPKPSKGKARLVIVAQSPGNNEVAEGEPLVGPSGSITDSALKRAGVPRAATHMTNAVLCQPPPKFKELDKAIKCCAPRLKGELDACREAGADKLLLMGDDAASAVYGSVSTENWWGVTLEHDGWKVMLSQHPARVLREQALAPIFKLAVKRAVTMPEWDWGARIHIDPGEEMLSALRELKERAAMGEPISVDVETRGIDPMYDTLMCIGLSTTDLAVSVPWDAYTAGKHGFVSPADDEHKELVKEILEDSRTKIVMHNGQHDVLSLKYAGIKCRLWFDTLLAHAVVAPQLPHKLEFVVSCFYPIEKWKTLFRATNDEKGSQAWVAREPRALRIYNAKDCLGTALAVAPLRSSLTKTFKGWALYTELDYLAYIAMCMRETGVLVDKKELARHRERVVAKIEECRTKFHQLVPNGHVIRGKDRFYKKDPITKEKVPTHVYTHVYVGPYRIGKDGQHSDLRKLFYYELGLKPLRYTESGLPALDDVALQQIIAKKPGTKAEQIARVVSTYREYGKLLSNYIDGMPIAKDGCVHPTFKVYGTVGSRWSSSDPNAQNIPKSMRTIFVSRPGKFFGAADWAQLELRILAELAGDTALFEAFDAGRSPHLELAQEVFKPKVITKDAKEYKLSKNVVYGLNYGAQAQKLYETLAPKFHGVTMALVNDIVKMWFQQHPHIATWRAEIIREANESRYVEAPLSGRREYFQLGEIEPTKVLNFPIQTTAGDLMNRAVRNIWSMLSEEESLLFQIHDEIVLEGPDIYVMRDKLKAAMEEPVNLAGRDVVFPIEYEWDTKLSGKMRDLPARA